jgi:hypothetical protein
MLKLASIESQALNPFARIKEIESIQFEEEAVNGTPCKLPRQIIEMLRLKAYQAGAGVGGTPL